MKIKIKKLRRQSKESVKRLLFQTKKEEKTNQYLRWVNEKLVLMHKRFDKMIIND